MLKESVTPQDVCDLLNGLLETDREFIQNLINSRIPCNKDVADHPTIQVQGYKDYPNVHTCGILGILNGLFGIRENGFGPLCCELDDESGEIITFKLIPKGKILNESDEEN